jgi:hypothetical protein
MRVVVLPKDISNRKISHLRELFSIPVSQDPTKSLHKLLGSDDGPMPGSIAYWRPRTIPAAGEPEIDKNRLAAVLCTEEQAQRAIKFAHNNIIFMGGTFGLSKEHVLMFTMMSREPSGRGVPIEYILFSLLRTAKLYSSSYNHGILQELLGHYAKHINTLSHVTDFQFCPKAICISIYFK